MKNHRTTITLISVAIAVILISLCSFFVYDYFSKINNTSASKHYSQNIKGKKSKNEGKDYTVRVKKLYNKKDYSNITESYSSNDYGISDDLSDMVQASDNVIKGKIISVDYTSIDGDAWTKVDVEIETSLKGDLKNGDKISVYQFGGYVSLEDHIKGYDDAFRYKDLSEEEIKKTILHETCDGEEDVKAGIEAIFMLNKTKRQVFPNGVYNRVRGKYSQLNKISGNKYRCYKDSSGVFEYKDISYSDLKKQMNPIC